MHPMLIVSNYGVPGAYPVFIFNPRMFSLSKGGYVKLIFTDPTGNQLIKSFQVTSVDDVALLVDGTFYPPGDPSRTYGTVEAQYSTDGTNYQSLAKAPLFVFKCEKYYALYPGESMRIGGRFVRKLYTKLEAKSNVKPATNSSEVFVNVYALAPAYMSVGPVALNVDIPPQKYIPVLAYTCRGTQCNIPIPKIESNYAWTPRFYYEVALIENGDIVGYYFADLNTFVRDAETGVIYVEKVLYKSTFRIDFAPEDKNFVKSVVSGKVKIVEEGSNYLIVEDVHGVGVPIIPLLTLVSIGLVSGAIISVSWISYLKETEITKQKEIEYTHLSDLAAKNIEYAKLVLTTLPPSEAAKVLLRVSSQINPAKSLKEDYDKISSELDTLKNIIMWVIIGAVVIAVLYLIGGLFRK